MRLLRLGPVLLFAACTASKANIQIVSAEESIRQARERHADEVARYEYTMAARYLEKAKEEAGYADFRVADALARQSAEWADRAIISTERAGRTNIELQDFGDPAASGGVPAPAPAAPKPVVPTGLEDILGPSATPAPGEPAPAPPEPDAPQPADPAPEAPIEDPEDDVEIPK